MWSSLSLILLCQATLANDGNHADITTEPHMAHFFLNTCVPFCPRVPFCPDLLYMIHSISPPSVSSFQQRNMEMQTADQN